MQTPLLDRLADSGTRFDSAYTNCPICVPARASLATGRYVHEIGYWDNAHPYDGRVPGWGHRLIDVGHRVEAIGKLHFRKEDDEDGFSRKIVPLNVVEGIGDVMASIRDLPPMRRGAREGITGAGPGTSTYLEYDAKIADLACRWLSERSKQPDEKPWVLFVSFVCPHPPYVAPPDLFEKYFQADIPMSIQGRPEEWPRHPVFDEFRRIMQWEQPFTEEQIRRVTAAYYGCCTHLDQQIGKVLTALEDFQLSESTRILYTSDHGESMGRRGLFGKFTMYEESAAIPFILAGPDVPKGQVCQDVISLVDCYQTVLEAVGVDSIPDESTLPGTSLWPIAQGESQDRIAFSEYHAVGSHNAYYMLRDGQYKLIYYVDAPGQLFDLESDPQELNNLAESPNYRSLLQQLEQKLRDLIDPEAIDAQAKASQKSLIERHGGKEALLKRGQFTNSPVPGETPVFH